MNQKTTLSHDDLLPQGVSIDRSNRLSTKSVYLDRKTSTSHYESQSDLIYSSILSQNQKSNCQNLHPNSIFLLRTTARPPRRTGAAPYPWVRRRGAPKMSSSASSRPARKTGTSSPNPSFVMKRFTAPLPPRPGSLAAAGGGAPPRRAGHRLFERLRQRRRRRR